ncbi:ubiquitin-associated (UBA)/TS-N domain-containing protein [Abeliophyllum distichum]|uniref:Ubiquitin-associated (UBA)/TS-N domain-containing protein n=1 Tax=Abeliophyllum distichum TaxID=126358 RepID=A0ABD1PNA4_9LAMI
METSTIVIKVKYEDMLRRFNAQIVDKELYLNVEGLREKIFSLFNFAPNTELTLTYTDEDGDVVTIVDDDDLYDVVRQALNPLRITVKVNTEQNGRKYARSSGSSTPLRLPKVQQPIQKLNANISEILKSVPEPLRETFLKLSTELASNTSSSAPGIAEIVDYFSKMGLSYLGQLSESNSGVQSSTPSEVPESTAAAIETKDLDSSKSEERSLRSNEGFSKFKPKEALGNNEVKPGNTTAGSTDPLSFELPGLKAVDDSIGALNFDVGYPDNESLHESADLNPKPSVVEATVDKKKKVKKIGECYSSEESHLTSSSLPLLANNIPTEKEVNMPSAPQLGPKPSNVGSSTGYASPMKWVHPGGGISYVLRSGSENSPVSHFCPGSFNNLPIFGIPVGNDSAVPPFRSIIQNDATESIVHLGVSCDGCGAHPITGPRFKSKVKKDYDLCDVCFVKMGNDTDYIGIGHAVDHRHPMSSKGLCGRYAKDRLIFRGCKARTGIAKLDSRFIQDVNIIDDTVMAPLTPFTKIWRMGNSGTLVWPQKTLLVWTGGDRLSNAVAVEVEVPAAGLPVDQEIDVAVDFVAPELPGRYISHWRMASPLGVQFGKHIWVHIQVVASEKEVPSFESFPGLNLNLPPQSNPFSGPEIIHVGPGTMVHDRQFVPANSKKPVELVEPLVDAQPNKGQEVKFPNNDILLVGGSASSPVSTVPSSISYPTIDLSELVPPLPSPSRVLLSVAPPSIANTQASVQEVSEKYEVEEKLLRELEEMGFKQELHEMGFVIQK